MKNCSTISAALKTKVVIPMLMSVIRTSAYEMELIGVVPSVDTIENATPNDIMNSPITNNEILLAVSSSPFNCILYYISEIIFKHLSKIQI
jgi:hypothetical protein